jgi:hypothetical protein
MFCFTDTFYICVVDGVLKMYELSGTHTKLKLPNAYLSFNSLTPLGTTSQKLYTAGASLGYILAFWSEKWNCTSMSSFAGFDVIPALNKMSGDVASDRSDLWKVN